MIDTNQAIRIRRLRKEFNVDGQHLVAVNDINLTMVKSEIFVLLGHNGAGKTTAINMMTGLLPKSGGDAFAFHKDLKDHLATETANVGICP
jgi:ABC-type multidrug transport system ATPase subunit